MKKSTQPLKENFSFLNQGLSCGMSNFQVKKDKASTLSQSNSPQNLRKEEKTNKKNLKQEKAKPNLKEKKCDKTLNRRQSRKTQKKTLRN